MNCKSQHVLMLDRLIGPEFSSGATRRIPRFFSMFCSFFGPLGRELTHEDSSKRFYAH